MRRSALPQASVTLFDARPADKDVSGDPRALALSLGSVQLLERLGAWRADLAQPILEVHVSQAPPSTTALLGSWFGEPELRIRAIDEAVPLLGAVLTYGGIVAPLQAAWLAADARRARSACTAASMRRVAALKNVDGQVEVDAGIAERFDLAVVAEGGVFADRSARCRRCSARPRCATTTGQTAWVGQVAFEPGAGPADRPASRSSASRATARPRCCR